MSNEGMTEPSWTDHPGIAVPGDHHFIPDGDTWEHTLGQGCVCSPFFFGKADDGEGFIHHREDRRDAGDVFRSTIGGLMDLVSDDDLTPEIKHMIAHSIHLLGLYYPGMVKA